MSEENISVGYDEDDAIKFIQNSLPQEMKGKFSDDEINYVIDIVYDFYEEKGFMDSAKAEEDLVEIDEDEIINYVLKHTKKDKVKEFTSDEITFIIQGELGYCETIDMFED